MRFSVILILLVLSGTASSQSFLGDRFYFGGGFGLSAGSDNTNISASPIIGYKITERYSAGLGIIYQYVKIQGFSESINNYGWSVFNRYNLTQQFFAQAEFENLQFEFFTSVRPERTARTGYNSFLIGGGYTEAIGGRSAFNVTALYNVLYDPADVKQPYNSPWVIRAGVGIGIL